MSPPVATAIAWSLALSSPYFAPGITWMALAAALGGSAVLVAQRTAGEPLLTRMVVLSFYIRCALALMLFAISSLHLPILPGLHRDYGLWEFGGDGLGYHPQAMKILDAWRTGMDLPSTFMIGDDRYDVYADLSLPMAIVYVVVGTSPLHFILVNAWIGAMSGVLAYLLVSRLGDRRSALAAAALVAFWPSSVLWSTQLLKDVWVHAALLSTLLLMVALWRRYSSDGIPHCRALSIDAVRWAALAAAVFGLTYFRDYLGTLLTISVGLVMAAALGRSIFRARWVEAAAALGMMTVVGVAMLLGNVIDLREVFSPPNPEVAHVRRGDALLEQTPIPASATTLESAIWSYRRAIQLNPRYAPAYRGLGLALVERGDEKDALKTLVTYLDLEPDPKQRERISPLVASISSRIGPIPRSSISNVAVTSRESLAALLARLRPAVPFPLTWFSASRLSELRRWAARSGGASVIDPFVAFDDFGDVFRYVPRALAIAYLSPFPSQWAFTGGASGAMRPIAAFEVVLIALLVPAMAVGFWHRVTRFRPEEWLVMVFIGIVAVGHGLMMPNAGTLFRLRLQFLFPSLILASTALPGFAYRFVDTASQWSVRASRAGPRSAERARRP